MEKIISIHSPRMGRDVLPGGVSELVHISIHSPRMGRDSGDFDGSVEAMTFQSTLPAWGETQLKYRASMI